MVIVSFEIARALAKVKSRANEILKNLSRLQLFPENTPECHKTHLNNETETKLQFKNSNIIINLKRFENVQLVAFLVGPNVFVIALDQESGNFLVPG